MSEHNYKEELSALVENIFKSYSEPGLHICDIATGRGKSHAISKLTCEYYPLHFERIIILCVQNKLVKVMNEDINDAISNYSKGIKASDILVIQNNPEVIKESIDNGTFSSLIDEMEYAIGEQQKKDSKINDLRYRLNHLKKIFSGLCSIIPSDTPLNVPVGSIYTVGLFKQ